MRLMTRILVCWLTAWRCWTTWRSTWWSSPSLRSTGCLRSWWTCSGRRGAIPSSSGDFTTKKYTFNSSQKHLFTNSVVQSVVSRSRLEGSGCGVDFHMVYTSIRLWQMLSVNLGFMFSAINLSFSRLLFLRHLKLCHSMAEVNKVPAPKVWNWYTVKLFRLLFKYFL